MGYDERSGRPKTATTDENIGKVHQMVLDDRRIKVREIADVMNMSKERVCQILNQHLGMRKLSARWVPCLLTVNYKLVRINISNPPLAQFRRNKSEFWRQLITVDETWIHHYTPETKKYSPNSGLQSRNRFQKKQKLILRLGKWWRLFFWDSHGVILIDYLQIFKKEKPLQEHTTHHYLIGWRQNLRKNGHICRKRKSCFTKTTHRLTPQLLPLRKSMNYDLNCSTFPLTHQI